MFTAVDVYGLVAWLTFTYWQLSSTSRDSQDWYDDQRKEIRCSPPGWVFGVAWTLLYGLIATSAFLYTRNYEEDNLYYIATIILLIVNIFLNKFWSVVFFDQVNARIGLALFIALAMLMTEIAILVLMGLSNAWIPFGLFAPYALWTAFAIYLNAQWYVKGLGSQSVKEKTTSISSKTLRTRLSEREGRKIRSVRYRAKRTTGETSVDPKKVIINLGA